MGKVKRAQRVKQIRVHGWDLSLNHLGIVELTNGALTRLWYVTDILKSWKNGKGFAELIKPPKSLDKQTMPLWRLVWWEEFITEFIDSNPTEYVGIEDYAFAKPQGAHQMGELGGIFRKEFWKAGSKMRYHDPMSVKMFVAHNGHADKWQMEDAVYKKWGIDFSRYNPPRSGPTKKNPDGHQNRQTSEDLADAFGVAQLVWLEYQLRKGLTTLDQLHEKEIQVFNRTTKSYPVNILGRNWIQREDQNEPAKIST